MTARQCSGVELLEYVADNAGPGISPIAGDSAMPANDMREPVPYDNP